MSNRTLGLLTVFLLFCSPVVADFSNSVVSLHPAHPGSEPFLISISGTWPTDCHPGEQLPVVSSFDGYTVQIEFEIIIVHVTCNEVETSYRSLVDMNDLLITTPPLSQILRVRVDFDGVIIEQSLELTCPDGEDCSDSTEIQLLPEKGLYITPARAKEGLLIDRQNQTAIVYPLVYDEVGSAEWLLSAALFIDGTYFAQLTRWHGGDCFDCEHTGAEAHTTSAGRISVFAEQRDMIWVKINDRPFSEYQRLVYGYELFDRVEGPPLTDLAGRWALSENYGTNPPLGDLSEILPPAFEIAFEHVTPFGDSTAATEIVYLVTTITGQELGQLVCNLQSASLGVSVSCSFIDPTDQAEPLLLFYVEGPSTLSIEYGRPLPAIGTPPGGRAIRLD